MLTLLLLAYLQALTDQELLLLLSGMPGMQYVPSQEWLASAVQRLDPALALSCGMGAGGAGSAGSSLNQEQRRQLQDVVQKVQYKTGVAAGSNVMSVTAATSAAQDQEQTEAIVGSDLELVTA